MEEQEGRFALLSDDADFKKLRKNSENATNANTKRSTNTWIKPYQEWASSREKCKYGRVDLLDECLAKFYGVIRKQDGKEYKRDTLRVM